jgi:ABC-type nitrate/sulfonate/bicarbonate transport system substrate-binding protein
MKWKLAPAAVIFLLSPAGSVPAQEKKLEPFVVAYTAVTGNRAPLWVGKDARIFEKYGLDLKLVQIGAGSVIMSALVAGEAHMAPVAAATVASAAAQGVPAVIVGTNGGAPYQLVAHPSIKSVQELKGKIVGTSRFGSGSDFMLRRMLANAGLVPSKDFSLIPTGFSESEKRLLLITQGKIDATLGEADAVFRFVEIKGQKLTVLGDSRDFGVPRAAADLATTRLLLKNYRARFKNFFMAYCEAIWMGRKNKELVYQAYRKYMRIDDPRMIEGTYKTQFLDTIPAKPYPNEEAVQMQIEDLASTVAPKLKGAKAQEFIDVTILKELESEGFFARLEKQ